MMVDNFNNSQTSKDKYTFAEISSVTSVKPYVLRFWETEFVEINPTFESSGEKIYSKEDLEFILLVKNLLFEQKMSIPEAKAFVAKSDIEHTIEESEEIVELEVKSSLPTEAPRIVQNAQASNFKNLSMAKTKLEIMLEEIDLLAKSHNWNI